MALLVSAAEGIPTKDEGLASLPDGGAAIRAARRGSPFGDFLGCLAGKTTKVATVEEIEQAIGDGWAGLVDLGD